MYQKSEPRLSRPLSGLMTILSIMIVTAQLSFSQQAGHEGDKTLSPYFFVMSNDTSVDQLPLKHTSADVSISGVIADVTVMQRYCNEGDSVLEAIYVFPASTRAAVYYMHMTVGNRLLMARIREREQAREEYEQAREEGRTVTLLEQERPNVFRMNVANILPGDTIEVEMKYTELLVPTGAEYEFVYPTVAGPRYASPSENGEEWVASPYQHEGEAPLYGFSINLMINAGMKIKNVYSPSHPANLDFEYPDENTVSCGANLNGNKDVVVRYRLAGNQIESGLLLYEGEEENFFLAMIQPPKNPQDYQIPPREYVFIMDVSGSMHGFPISVSKVLLSDLVRKLRPRDRFNMIFFASGNYLLAESSLPATEENINKALDAIDNHYGGGGTELLPALQRALDLPGTGDFARTFIIATDGYVTVERQAFELIRNNLNNANFFAFGIGSSVNRYIIEGIAHAGMGEPFIVLNQEEAAGQADLFREYIQYPVLTNIEVGFEGFDVCDVEPPHVPDVFAERPVILFGKYKGQANGQVRLKGLTGVYDHQDILQVSDYEPSVTNAALRYLWARNRIRLLDGYGNASYDSATADSIRQEIIRLGLTYNLLTQYTSFIAVDSVIRNDSGSVTTVKQPLPLPEGVSDYALGDRSTIRTESYSGINQPTAYIPSVKAGNTRFGINKCYPNPFTASTTILITINPPEAAKTKLIRIYNSLGELIDEIDISRYQEGIHEMKINFSQAYPLLPPGLYHVHLIIGNEIDSRSTLVYVKR